jgi:diguanylate cyclase (GGDEF)-like protein
VLPECSLSDAFAVATRVRSSLTSHALETEDGPLPLTASFGVASTQQCPGARLSQLLKAADLAMYRAKHEGRDRVTLAADADWRQAAPSTPTAATA